MTSNPTYDEECFDALAANDCTFTKQDLYDRLSAFCDPKTLLPGVFGDDGSETEGNDDAA